MSETTVDSANASITFYTPTGTPQPPTLTTGTVTATSIGLSWNTQPTVPNLGFKVYRSTSGGAFVFLSPAITATTYNDTGLVTGTTYAHRVTACTLIGGVVTNESAPSNTVTNVPSATSVAWFTQPADKTWIALSNNLISDVTAGQATIGNNDSGGICKVWNPACVDQVRGEYLLVGNGGHNDYHGNEVYAIGLRQATPRWYRLLDHSPGTSIPSENNDPLTNKTTSNTPGGQNWDANGYAGMLFDGRRRANHGWYDQHFFNGKSWNINMGSPTGVGPSVSHMWSFDRAYPGLATAFGQTPLAYPASPGAGPWKWLGTSDSGNKATNAQYGALGNSPACALDPVTGKIWYAHGDQGNWFAGWGNLDTATETMQHTSVSSPWSEQSGFGAIAIDPAWDGVFGDPNNTCRWRLFVYVLSANGSGQQGQLAILNLKAANPMVFSAWSRIVPSTTTGLTQNGNGMVYHKASTSFLVGNPVDRDDGSLTKIKVPLNGDGTYNAAGPWFVSSIAAANNPFAAIFPTSISPGGNGGGRPYGKMRLVENIANGQDGIAYVQETGLPMWVYKLPLLEIF